MFVSFQDCHNQKEVTMKAEGKLPQDGKLSFATVAEATGISSETVAKFFHGRHMRFLLMSTFGKLLDYYNCQSGDVFYPDVKPH